MRAVCQRVGQARVRVAGEIVAEIGPGLCVLLGVGRGDAGDEAARLAGKVTRLRVFPDAAGRFDRSLLDAGKKVGVTANSHAVIGNLLGEVGRPAVQRCDEDDWCGKPDVRWVKSSTKARPNGVPCGRASRRRRRRVWLSPGPSVR